MKVLMLGNSFTYFNDMPNTLSSMIRTAEPDTSVTSITYGGYTLSQYVDETTEIGKNAIEKMSSGKWDYIVLQEQSLLPCTNPQRFFDAVERIRQLSAPTGAKPILYETWAYKDGSEKLASTGMSYRQMNATLQDAYHRAAELIGGRIAPVGEAFEHILSAKYSLHLISHNDNYHPSASGSYLAACVLFRTLTGKSAIGLPCPSSVSLYNLSVIQKVTDTMA